jgi:eukaryotic-like serine/threonine-protein kinase
MKKTHPNYGKILLILCLTLAVLVPGCSRAGSSINGSGTIIDQNLKVKDFNSINIQGPFSLEIVRSDAYQVTLSTDNNLMSRLQISLERRTLKVRIEAPAAFFPTSLKIRIAMPDITSLNLSGRVKAVLTGFKSISDFTLFLSDDCIVTGDLEAIIARFHLSKSCQVGLTGSSMRLELECSGSKLDLENFFLITAQVKLEEGSEAVLNVAGRFDVVLNGASKIFYLGNPLISNTSISGGSSMEHK